MMENQKLEYFTPSIEDIRVGYECEMNDGFLLLEKRESNTWKGKTLSTTDIFNIGDKVSYWIRVAYLTKEQIEAEGWENKNKDYYKSIYSLWKGDFRIEKLKENYNLVIHKVTRASKVVYDGECKDINTFRYICKLLVI